MGSSFTYLETANIKHISGPLILGGYLFLFIHQWWSAYLTFFLAPYFFSGFIMSNQIKTARRKQVSTPFT